ncbi:MAG: hypothetical protein NVS3B19_20280 [Ginsengibacter sp.]
MTEHKTTGNWSIPGGKSYPGQLDVNYETGTMILEIYSTEYIDGVAIDFKNDLFAERATSYFNYIWGNTDSGSDITLYRCIWLGTAGMGTNLFSTKYEADFRFLGIHVTAEKEFLIKSGKFSFPYLGGFYNGWHHESIPATEFDYTRIGKVTEHALAINDELELTFSSGIVDRILELSVAHKIETNDYLIFTYKNDVPFSRLLNDSVTFRKLLEFSQAKPLRHKIHSIRIDFSQLKLGSATFIPQNNPGFSVTNFTLSDNKKIAQGAIQQNHMLISNWKMAKDDLNALIIQWYNNTHLYNIYDYYLDSNNWFQGVKDAKLSNVMFNNRFLNLIQGLEDYYREHLETLKVQNARQNFDAKKKAVLDSIKDAALKNWLNNTFKATQYAKLEEKLLSIASDCRPVLEKVFKPIDWTLFPQTAKDFRHKLSHGMNKNTNMGPKLNLDYHMARLLLCICILKTNICYRNFSSAGEI